ncbi:hypothetical protein [Spiroplasma endosymbiont of Stenodema calcarata]|uniref:hypothetical protein n=1 Tax=Spiroplasma endosymbiont of Stenodema calcarata TaxID=3139328 RepID=UPI003CCAB7C6
MNKLEIKHKRTNEIIMTIEYKNSISKANLSKAKNINYDYLIGANTCVKKMIN